MTPREFLGPGSLIRLRSIIDDLSPRNIFLFTGKESFKLSGAERCVMDMLQGVPVEKFDDFAGTPNLSDIKKGLDFFSGKPCDLVIAIGGGSVIDTGKLVNVFLQHSDTYSEIAVGRSGIITRGKPFVAIPTTAGSGSEATHFAVIYVDKTKYSVAHPCLLPDYAIVDPELTYSLTPRATAESGLDALSQAIESFWAVGATDESRSYSREAIPILLRSLTQAVHEPTPEVRNNMAAGAHLAGKAINIAKTTGPHALSYALTAHYNVSHGHAVALTLGIFFIINACEGGEVCNGGKSRDQVRAVMQDLFEIMGYPDARSCCKAIQALIEDVGLESDFRSLGLDKQDIGLIIDSVNLERVQNNPVCIDAEMLRALLKIS